jgi:hypothetical protein
MTVLASVTNNLPHRPTDLRIEADVRLPVRLLGLFFFRHSCPERFRGLRSLTAVWCKGLECAKVPCVHALMGRGYTCLNPTKVDIFTSTLF